MILVTGATGLVGAHLLARLVQENQPVRAMYRTETKKEATKAIFAYYGEKVVSQWQNIEWVKADVTDVPSLEIAFKGIKQVYHTAGFVSFFGRDLEQLHQVNIEGTANVVNACLAFHVQKLVHVSSIATLSKKVGQSFVDESCDWNPEEPHSDYAITKNGAEVEVWRGAQEGLDVVVVNPGVILGAGFWNQSSSTLFSRVAKGLSFYTSGQTGFVGVKDVVNAMVLLMQSNEKNKRFVLVGESQYYKEVMSLIALEMGKKAPSISISKRWVRLIYIVSEFLSFILQKNIGISRFMFKSMFNQTSYKADQIVTVFPEFAYQAIDEVVREVVEVYPVLND